MANWWYVAAFPVYVVVADMFPHIKTIFVSVLTERLTRNVVKSSGARLDHVTFTVFGQLQVAATGRRKSVAAIFCFVSMADMV